MHANILFLSVCLWAVEVITAKRCSTEHVCFTLGKCCSFPHLEFRNTVTKIWFDFSNPCFIFEEAWRSTKNDKYLGRAPSVLFVVRERWTSGISSPGGSCLQDMIRRAFCWTQTVLGLQWRHSCPFYTGVKAMHRQEILGFSCISSHEWHVVYYILSHWACSYLRLSNDDVLWARCIWCIFDSMKFQRPMALL